MLVKEIIFIHNIVNQNFFPQLNFNFLIFLYLILQPKRYFVNLIKYLFLYESEVIPLFFI